MPFGCFAQAAAAAAGGLELDQVAWWRRRTCGAASHTRGRGWGDSPRAAVGCAGFSDFSACRSMALDAIFSEGWARDIERQVHADEESKRRAEAGYAAAEVEHERHGWRHACRSGADGDVTGEYDDLESEHPSKRQKLPGQVGVLMVCQSNLARSPAAAAVFLQKAEEVGTGDQFFVDSCGLGGGNPVS